jgi:putative FmdB family regulatory protein
MPIYAYKCETCGHAADVLQKISEPVLTQCPACGASTYVKQVTAAGFQLKGSGWYVTDFRDGGGKKQDKTDASKAEGDAKAGAAPAAAAPASAPATAPAAAAAASPAASPSPSP